MGPTLVLLGQGTARLRQAAQQAGIPATDDFNRGDNNGVGYFDVNQKNGGGQDRHAGS